MKRYPARINRSYPGRCGNNHTFRAGFPKIFKEGSFAGTSFSCKKYIAVGMLEEFISKLKFRIWDAHQVLQFFYGKEEAVNFNL